MWPMRTTPVRFTFPEAAPPALSPAPSMATPPWSRMAEPSIRTVRPPAHSRIAYSRTTRHSTMIAKGRPARVMAALSTSLTTAIAPLKTAPSPAIWPGGAVP